MLNKTQSEWLKQLKLFRMVNTAGLITFVVHIVGRRFGKTTGNGQLYKPRNTS